MDFCFESDIQANRDFDLFSHWMSNLRHMSAETYQISSFQFAGLYSPQDLIEEMW